MHLGVHMRERERECTFGRAYERERESAHLGVHTRERERVHISNQIKSLLLSHHHSTSALVSEIHTSVLQTVQKNKTTIYIWTVHIYRLYRRQCAKYTYTQYT